MAIKLSGKTKSSVARECGIASSYLHQIIGLKTGLANNDLKKKLAEATNVSPQWLIHGDESKKPDTIINVDNNVLLNHSFAESRKSLETSTSDQVAQLLEATKSLIPKLTNEQLMDFVEVIRKNPQPFWPILDFLLVEIQTRMLNR